MGRQLEVGVGIADLVAGEHCRLRKPSALLDPKAEYVPEHWYPPAAKPLKSSGETT